MRLAIDLAPFTTAELVALMKAMAEEHERAGHIYGPLYGMLMAEARERARARGQVERESVGVTLEDGAAAVGWLAAAAYELTNLRWRLALGLAEHLQPVPDATCVHRFCRLVGETCGRTALELVGIELDVAGFKPVTVN